MIISEDHILQEELNNLRGILLARAYPLHLIIKNIKEIAKNTTRSTIWKSKPLSAYIKSSSILNHLIHSTQIWLLTAGSETLLPTYTHIHQYRHTHSDIIMVI